jgi:citrate synthase
MLAETNPDFSKMHLTARRLEKMVVAKMGENKKIFQNVDLYSGIIYHPLRVPEDLYTVLFAASRFSGWTTGDGVS